MTGYFDTDELSSLVMDWGSGMSKAGFGGDDAPRAVFQSIVGQPKFNRTMTGMGQKTNYIGDEAHAKSSSLKISWPIERGVVSDWKKFENITHHTPYNELCVAPEEHPYMVALHLGNHRNNEKYTEHLFEVYHVPAIYYADPAFLSLCGSGETSGVAVECGHGSINIAVVIDWCQLPQGMAREEIGGYDMTQFLKNSLNNRGYLFNTSDDILLINEAKEKIKLFVRDGVESIGSPNTCEYKLPDGSVIHLGEELSETTELMFQPSIIGKRELLGVHELIYQSIMRCPASARKQLFENIFLSGGVTMVQGFRERVEKELQRLVPEEIATIKVTTKAERKYTTWIGGSLLASLSSMSKHWVSKKDYDEEGPNAWRHCDISHSK